MSEENKQNKLQTQDDFIPAITDETLIVVAEQAERRVEAMNKIKKHALKLTNRHDWVDQDGKPYLQSSGAEKVARMFGISWRISEPTIENLDAGHYIVTYTGEFSLAGATIQAVGTRSSKDGFFKKYRYEEGKRVGELPASEIDRGDVKKSAYSNLLGNGITRLLGIRNLTYEDLQECAGLRKQDIASIGYKKEGKPPPGGAPGQPPGKAPASQPSGPGAPGAKPPPQQPSQPDAPATEAQCRAIHAILKERLGIGDELAKHQKVALILGLTAIPTSMSKLTKGQASTVIEHLQKEAEAAAEQPQEEVAE